MEINITTSSVDRVKLALVKHGGRLSSLLNFEITTCFNGASFKIPVEHSKGTHFADQQYLSERGSDIFHVLSIVLPQRSGAVLDIGANIGLIMYMVSTIDKTRRYIAFEPNLVACAYLQRLINANELENHTVVPFALSNNRGTVDLKLNGETDVSATIVSGIHGQNWFRNSQQVVVATGDEIIPSVLRDDTPIALIKIDVEGAELEVLEGLDGSVDKYRPVIIFELWPLDENRGLQDATESELNQIFCERRRRTREIERYFEAKEYSIFKMHQSGALTQREKLLEDRIDNRHDLNFLAVPQEESTLYEGRET